MILEDIIWDLKKIWVLHLRWSLDDCSKWEDIDLYVPESKVHLIKDYLREKNFSLTLEDSSKIFFKYQEGEVLIILDIMKNFNYIFHLFPWLVLKDSYVNTYLSDPQKNNISFACIRYIHTLRSDQKSLKLFSDNWDSFTEQDYYLSSVNFKIFKKSPWKQGMLDILNKKAFSIIKYIKIKYIFLLPIGYFKKYKQHINAWTIICLSGVDWVGKTTICNIIQKMSRWKYIYLWYWDTKSLFWNYFNKMTSRNTFILLTKYFLRYIENLILVPVIFYYKFTWRTVILDRHPLLETAQLKKWLNHILSTVLYKYLYIRPRFIFVLYEDPEVIYKRKPEKSVSQINNYQTNLRTYIDSNNLNVEFIKNDDINKTCSAIFYSISKYKWK